MRILIGYDGSDGAVAALEDLGAAGLPAAAEAVVLAVADLPVEVPFARWERVSGPAGDADLSATATTVAAARDAAAAARAEAERQAAAGADRVASLFPGWTVRGEAVSDSPYWALVKRADRWPADLVVVGSHGRSGLGRLILGSVSQSVLSHAGCSVRVGRRLAAADPPGARPPRLLIGVDGSDGALAAVRAVAGRAWPAGTEARVVAAVDLKLQAMAIWGGLQFAEAAGEDPLEPGHRHAGAAAARLRAAGLIATAVVLPEDPKAALVAEAERWPADCVFLGARGHSRIERFLIGSVSAAVAARASCSVEVVRPTGRP